MGIFLLHHCYSPADTCHITPESELEAPSGLSVAGHTLMPHQCRSELSGCGKGQQAPPVGIDPCEVSHYCAGTRGHHTAIPSDPAVVTLQPICRPLQQALTLAHRGSCPFSHPLLISTLLPKTREIFQPRGGQASPVTAPGPHLLALQLKHSSGGFQKHCLPPAVSAFHGFRPLRARTRPLFLIRALLLCSRSAHPSWAHSSLL